VNWDGTSWTKAESPNTGIYDNVLNSVSCVSESSCVAAGYYVNGAGTQSLVLKWDGTSWTKLDSPNSGSFSNIVSSVSCATGFSCLAVGRFDNGIGSVDQTLVLLLTGPEPPATTTTSSTTSTDPVAPAFTG